MAKNKGGRPTSMTEDTINKLEYAFAIGCTDREASLYADITPATLYEYCKKNPKYSERKELLKQKPILQARESVVKGLKDDYNHALKFLERKKSDEFSTRTTSETTNETNVVITKEEDQSIDDLIDSII